MIMGCRETAFNFLYQSHSSVFLYILPIILVGFDVDSRYFCFRISFLLLA